MVSRRRPPLSFSLNGLIFLPLRSIAASAVLLELRRLVIVDVAPLQLSLVIVEKRQFCAGKRG